MPKRRVSIGRAEMRVLDYVHKHGPVSVTAVATHFKDAEGVGRTTVLNVMVRLWRKRYLNRKAGAGGGHLYTAREPRPRLLRKLVGQFVGDVLGGSVSPFVAYLSETAGDLTEEDRRQLATLLRQLESEHK